jgi:RNA polymerase sigma factor (sigma-70 family)
VDACSLDLRHHPVPDQAEQLKLGRLIRAWQDHPDGPAAAPALVIRRGKRALDRLVAGNLRLVLSLARRHGPWECELDDLLQAGSLGLTAAAKRFNPALGYTFSTYATWYVRQKLQEMGAQRHTIALPVDVVTLADRTRAIHSRLAAHDGRATLAAVAAEITRTASRPVTPERLARVLAAASGSRCTPLSDGAGGAAPGCDPLAAAEGSERVERVRAAIEQLEADEQQLVLAIDFEDVSYRSMAAILGVHSDTVRKRHRRAHHRMAEMLQDLVAA